MHACDVQQHAYAHGPDSPFANIRCSGKRIGNAERDLHRRVRQNGPFLRSLGVYEFQITVLKDKGLGVEKRKCAFHLPSDIFSAFYKFDKALFRRTLVGSEEALRRYWTEFRKLSHFERHPFKDAIIESPEKCIPTQFLGR